MRGEGGLILIISKQVSSFLGLQTESVPKAVVTHFLKQDVRKIEPAV